MSQYLSSLPVIECVQVVYPNGDHIYEPLADYVRNPAPGTYRLTESRKCAPEFITGNTTFHRFWQVKDRIV